MLRRLWWSCQGALTSLPSVWDHSRSANAAFVSAPIPLYRITARHEHIQTVRTGYECGADMNCDQRDVDEYAIVAIDQRTDAIDLWRELSACK